VIPDEAQAVDGALAMARPGDLVLLFADALTRTWNQVTHFVPAAGTPARAMRPRFRRWRCRRWRR
jgi:cyanophycin synthetase